MYIAVLLHGACFERELTVFWELALGSSYLLLVVAARPIVTKPILLVLV